MASLPAADRPLPASISSSKSAKRKRKRNGKSSHRPLVPSAPSLLSSKDDDNYGKGQIGPTASTPVPRRDCTDLFLPVGTYRCATANLCVPCAYKVGTYDVALDSNFTARVTNARPESCPRFGVSTAAARVLDDDGDNVSGGGGVMGYRRGMSVLMVGDGDLSFSLAVARLILSRRPQSSGGRRSRLVATSYESRDCLLRVYPGIESTIDELEALGATVCYEVDATRLVETLPDSVLYGREGRAGKNTGAAADAAEKISSNKKPGVKFHRIAWNFPCSAVSSGQDGQNDAMETNKRLIREFVRNATEDGLLSDEGGSEIHMTHKTKPPFNQWRMESVALEGLGATGDHGGGNGNGSNGETGRTFEYKGRIVFDRCIIPPYTPRKALDKKSFTCHDACVYVFGWGSGLARSKAAAPCEFPPTIPLEHANVGNVGETEGGGTTADATIVPVTQDMLLKVRSLHLVNAAAPKTRKGKKRRRKEKKRPL